MSNRFEFPVDFDSKRVIYDELGGRIGVDPKFPEFIIRETFLSEWSLNLKTGKWEKEEIADTEHIAEQTLRQNMLTLQEFEKIEASGVKIPDHSEFGLPIGVTDGRHANYYLYVRRLMGDMFIPSDSEHGQFIEPYILAAERYFGPKEIGDTFLTDSFISLNHTVGHQYGINGQVNPELFLHDLDAFVEPLTNRPPHETDEAGITSYEITLTDLKRTVTSAAKCKSISQDSAATLMTKIEGLYKH